MELKLYTAPLKEIRAWSGINPVMLFRFVNGHLKTWTPGNDFVPTEWLFDPPDDVCVTYSHVEDKA